MEMLVAGVVCVSFQKKNEVFLLGVCVVGCFSLKSAVARVFFVMCSVLYLCTPLSPISLSFSVFPPSLSLGEERAIHVLRGPPSFSQRRCGFLSDMHVTRSEKSGLPSL